MDKLYIFYLLIAATFDCLQAEVTANEQDGIQTRLLMGPAVAAAAIAAPLALGAGALGAGALGAGALGLGAGGIRPQFPIGQPGIQYFGQQPQMMYQQQMYGQNPLGMMYPPQQQMYYQQQQPGMYYQQQPGMYYQQQPGMYYQQQPGMYYQQQPGMYYPQQQVFPGGQQFPLPGVLPPNVNYQVVDVPAVMDGAGNYYYQQMLSNGQMEYVRIPPELIVRSKNQEKDEIGSKALEIAKKNDTKKLGFTETAVVSMKWPTGPAAPVPTPAPSVASATPPSTSASQAAAKKDESA